MAAGIASRTDSAVGSPLTRFSRGISRGAKGRPPRVKTLRPRVGRAGWYLAGYSVPVALRDSGGFVDLEIRGSRALACPHAQDELELHAILLRRLAEYGWVASDEDHRRPLLADVGSEFVEKRTQLVRDSATPDSDAEGHPTYRVPADGPAKHRFVGRPEGTSVPPGRTKGSALGAGNRDPRRDLDRTCLRPCSAQDPGHRLAGNHLLQEIEPQRPPHKRSRGGEGCGPPHVRGSVFTHTRDR